MIVSIHQPNYLPWLGLFHKILLSDIYVIFDDVQLRRGKSFVLRSLIKTEKNTKWITIPVLGKSKFLLINQVEINSKIPWKEKHWTSIENSYRKAEFFRDYSNEIRELVLSNHNNLSQFNVSIIKKILEILDIKIKMVKSSELNIATSGTQKIIDTVLRVGGTTYLSGEGQGSKRYVIGQEKKFSENGIKLKIQNFIHPTYSQLFGDFIPNLSIIDLIFNIGIKKTKEKLKSI